MRVLFTTYPAQGHFTPLVPLAGALAAAGHEVAVATAEALRGPVEQAGFELLPAGISDEEAFARLLVRCPEVAGLSGIERARRTVPGLFVDAWVPALLEDADRLLGWRPEIVVREEGEFGGPVLASLAGVPWVDHGWGPLRPAWMVDAVARALEPIWHEHGVSPVPAGGAYRWLYLDPCPPSLQTPRATEINVRQLIRPWALQLSRSERVPDWLPGLAGRPCVYVTLGTIARIANDSELLRIALAALADRDLEVVVTVGRDGDPDALGPQPARVHVERFVPQGAVLPHCVAAVTNGGAGSMLGALAHGVPLLMIPALAPSQPRNAQAVADAGAGRMLERTAVTVDRMRTELAAILEDPAYREVAQRIAREIDQMPAASDAVRLVERLAADRQPPRTS